MKPAPTTADALTRAWGGVLIASVPAVPAGDAAGSGVRAVFVLLNFWQRLTGSAFRVFVHPPQRMDAVLEAAGLARAARHETLVWRLDLYRRRNASG